MSNETLKNYLAGLLVKHGIVDEQAVQDPDGFDNYKTLDAIRLLAADLNEILKLKP